MTGESRGTSSDPGATASDACAGVLTGSIAASGSVDANTPGSYTRSYTVSDGNGNSATKTRTVNVVDTQPPTLTVTGDNPMTVECHGTFSDPGATASDACAGVLTGSIAASGSVDANTPGSYTRSYTVSDGNGHSATKTRTVNVVDTQPPTVTVTGDNPMTVECHGTFSDPGATASDASAGVLTGSSARSGSVDANTPGRSAERRAGTDGNGHSATKTRTENVVDTKPAALP